MTSTAAWRVLLDCASLHERVRAVLLSVAWGQLDPKDLVDWTMATGLPLRVQLQMHKVIWPPDARGV